MRRDAQHKLRRCKTAKWTDSGVELCHACRTPRRVRPEHFLIHDPTPAELVQRAQHSAATARFGDAGDAARPAVADAGHRRLVKRLRARRLLQLANAPDPCEELGLVVLDPTTEMRELEGRMTADEARQQFGLG